MVTRGGGAMEAAEIRSRHRSTVPSGCCRGSGGPAWPALALGVAVTAVLVPETAVLSPTPEAVSPSSEVLLPSEPGDRSTSLEAAGPSIAVAWRGQAVSIALAQATEQRIVSLVPGATELLFELGVGSRVVGVSSYDRWPDQVSRLPRVGGLIDPNLEGILDLRPDLVVVDPGQVPLAERLADAGIATIAYGTRDVETVLGAAKTIGKAVGLAAKGELLSRNLRAELEGLRRRYGVGDRPRTLLVFERQDAGFGNLYINGGTGFLHELIEIAGGVNLFADVGRPSFKAGLEAILSRSPEVVLELRPGLRREAAEIASIEAEWRRLPGLAQVRVGVLISDSVVLPGPRMAMAVRLIASFLHPDKTDGRGGSAELSRKPGDGAGRPEKAVGVDRYRRGRIGKMQVAPKLWSYRTAL